MIGEEIGEDTGEETAAGSSAAAFFLVPSPLSTVEGRKIEARGALHTVSRGS